MRSELAQALPDVLQDRSPPDVLLAYQKAVVQATAANPLTVVEKSRRIGVTWAIGADAVLTSAAERSAGGMDTFYIGYEKEMTREFVDTCAMWAKAFVPVACQVEEFIFRDGEGDDTREIQAFRIRFASGFDITALCSRPRSLRGRQGYVILDEAAFHDDLKEVLKAALAFLIWGGKVLVISTHNGVTNPFNELVEDVRSGKQRGKLLRITFDDAIADGLYRRICLVKQREWSPEAERQWIDDIRAIYRDNAAEELDVIPKMSGGTYLPRALVEARMSRDIPVLRWAVPETFVDQPQHITQAAARDWCEEHLKPLLSALDPKLMTYFGQDFGRTGDLSVLWPLQLQKDLVRRTPFVVELRRVPFEEQKLIVFYILDRLPRFMFGAFDAGGNGASQAEAARRKYSVHRIAEVKFTAEWYRVNMPKLKAGFEGESIIIPADADIRTDFQAITMQDGVAKVPNDARTIGADGGQRHGDGAIAGALAWYASENAPAPIEFQAVGRERVSSSIDDFVRGF